MLAQLDSAQLQKALFLTLTYPAHDPTAKHAKKHLDSMLKRIRRRFPGSTTIWKLEYTKRETPHFHCLLLGVPYWHYHEVANAWASIVKSDHPSFKQAATQIRRLVAKRHPGRYICKYVSKGDAPPLDHQGRFWGIIGQTIQYLSQQTVWSLDHKQHRTLRRLLDAIRKSRARRRHQKFRRYSRMNTLQHWFIEGGAITRIMDRIGIPQASAVPTLG